MALITIPIEFATVGKNEISLQGLALVLGTNLGITADLPTFFRHSASWKSSVRALTIIQILTFLLGVGALFFGSLIHPWLGVKEGADFENTLLKSSLIIIVFVSVICANVSNVYSASVGWELVAPVLAGRKEYLILGLGLTIIFILISNIFSMDTLLETTDVCLVNLSLVLILSFIIRKFEHKPPDLFEKSIYFAAWFVASLVNILQFVDVIPNHTTLPIGTGIIVGILILGMGMRKIFKLQQN
jgi:purine-cytosine permease-like protein